MLFGRWLARRTWVAVAALSTAALGIACGSAQRAPAVSVVMAGASGGAGAIFWADLAPIVALAAGEPFLWIGSDRGLRRARLPAGETEWMGPETGLAGRRVSALAADGAGGVWVATDAGVGRLSDAAGAHPRFQPLAPLPGVTRLVPVKAGPGSVGGAWAGTAAGLYFLEGTAAFPVAGVPKVAITFLSLDADGASAWVGASGHGLLHVDRHGIRAVFGPDGLPGSKLDFVDAFGVGVLPNGTPFSLGRGRDGVGRIVLLRADGPALLEAETGLAATALITGPTGPLLVAGTAARPALFTLVVAERGAPVGAGGFRFSPPRGTLEGFRVVARPDLRGLPAEITTVEPVGAEIYVGTRAAGVARLASPPAGSGTSVAGPTAPGVAPTQTPTPPAAPVTSTAPEYLPVGELVAGAKMLAIACLERERCVIATGAGPGWIWDGRAPSIQPVPVEALGAPLMALGGGGGGGGAVYFVATEGPHGIRVARLSADGSRWEPLETLPVKTEGTPLVTYATVSPEGNLWMALRDRLASGQEVGRGVIELQLPAGRAIHHRAYLAGEPRPPEALPITGDVRAIQFQKGAGAASPDAIWFCTSLGVSRFAGGDLAHWGENEGLASESCDDLAIAPDGTVWVATQEGAARFDGKIWRAFDDEGGRPGGAKKNEKPNEMPIGKPDEKPGGLRWPIDRAGDALAARALVVIDQGVWAGTGRGVWPLSGAGRPLDQSAGLIDDDVRDLVVDRFGRLWVLGRLGLTIIDLPLRAK